MKNAINYYYNLNPEDIHQTDDKVKFIIDNNHYTLLPYNRKVEEINQLIEVSVDLYYRGIYSHQFIYNINKEILTTINNKLYVLLIILIKDYPNKIKFDDIIYFVNNSNIIKGKELLNRQNWANLWMNKIDYFEYQISQFGKKYPLIRESFSYYIGLAENSIIFIKNVQISNVKEKSYITHRRISYDYTLFDLYNPLNYVTDTRIRDISEYLKNLFFYSNEDIYSILIEYFQNNQLTTREYLLLFGRFLFPSYYFDVYEKIIHDDLAEKNILMIIKKVDDYEIFLSKLHFYLKNIISIPEIEWLSKRHFSLD